MRKTDWNKPRNKTSDPFIGFNFDEILNPYSIKHILKSFVSHGTIVSNECLQRICEIILIREINVFTFENTPHTLNINFILGWLVRTQANKLNFLDLKYFPMVYLTYHRSLGDNNQVPVNFHINNPIDCFNGSLFIKIIWRYLVNPFTILIWKAAALNKQYISII